MRDQISVKLDPVTQKALQKIVSLNKCTISDAVNAAIIAYSGELNATMCLPESPIDRVIAALPEGLTLEQWCIKRQIKIDRLRYLMKRIEKGSTVWGTGNTKNKWRDRNDDRKFKTHTAWISHWLLQDLGIDIT